MSDLTPIFTQCANIVSQELKDEIRTPHVASPSYLVTDSFADECFQVYEKLGRLSAFVSEVRPLYLQVNDEAHRFGGGQKREFSSADKQGIDEDFKLQVQQVYEKLKHLQEYERKRAELSEKSKKSKGFISSVFSSTEDDPVTLYQGTLASHRMHILRFLSENTKNVNASFEAMHKQRYNREKQLNLLNIQNLDDEDDTNFPLDDFGSSGVYQMEVTDFNDQDSQSPIQSSQLTQEQIQEFSSENKALLEMKTNQFKQVEKLHHSMVDIVKLQTELTMHLETQADQINSLLDNQDQIDLDLRLGNSNLAKATDRNKRGSNLIVATCMVLGFLLLFVDYIS